jgi:Peptidase family M1 domain
MALVTAVTSAMLVVTAGCSPGGSWTRPTARSLAPAPTQPAASCPSSYLSPGQNRPRVTLTFDVAADLTTVTGREDVRFAPAAGTGELVFRLLPNGIEGGRAAGDLRVTAAGVALAGSATPSTAAPLQPASFSSAGGRAGTQGTVLRLRLPRPVHAGESVVARLDFVLRLPPVGVDRYGHDSSTAWWGSGHPLLAWVDGHGWATDPVAVLPAETAASEAAATDLTVTAPAADTVLATGTAAPPATAAPGRRRWHFRDPAARDVAVLISRFRLASDVVSGVPVTVGTAIGLAQRPADVLAEVRAALLDHSARFGPYPFPSLSVAVLPGIGGAGIEYPGAVMLGDTSSYRLVVAHELAHQWFYGLVGDNQAEHPWLDESFATYAEALRDRDGDDYLPALNLPSRVDLPTGAFPAGAAGERQYSDIVYAKGAAALLSARAAAGTARFDAAVRCYVAANAWRVVYPPDLARALAGLPKATAVLRAAGAL